MDVLISVSTQLQDQVMSFLITRKLITYVKVWNFQKPIEK